MREYLYTFEKSGQKYLVYAPSQKCAIERYLQELNLSDLPKGTTITRTNA